MFQPLFSFSRQIMCVDMAIKAFWIFLQEFGVMGSGVALPAVRNFAMFIVAAGTGHFAMQTCRSGPFLENTAMTGATGSIGCFRVIIDNFFGLVDWVTGFA
jgi:hypothetical protein